MPITRMVNNLHCLFLAGGEHLITTPTYHVFDMMQDHMGGEALRVSGAVGEIARGKYKIPCISASASLKDGVLTVTLANLSVTESAEVKLNFSCLNPAPEAEYAVLTADDPHAHNTYEDPDKVALKRTKGAFDGTVIVPAFSAVTVSVQV